MAVFAYKVTMIKILAVTTGLLLICSSIFAGPELEIVNNRFDFGMVPQRSTLAQYFWFKSIGDDTLVINEIKTGCTCALMPLERDTLPPGDSTLVGIYWNIGKSIYKTGRYPYIFTNATPDPYRIFLTAEVYPATDTVKPLSCSPYILALSSHPKASVNEVTFTVSNHMDEDVDLQVVSFPLKECDLELPDKIGKQSSIKGTIKVKPEYLDKEFKSSITIYVNTGKEHRLTIPVHRKIFK